MSFRAGISLIALVALIFGCARVQSPPGGEVDKTPAELVDSWPRDGSLGNGELESVTLTFSEPVNRASVLDKLRSDPPWLLRAVRWQADTLLALRFWEPFPADTTISLYLEPGWRDRHRVEQTEWQVVNFATGEKLLAGWLAGTATFKGNPSRLMHLVLSDSTGGVQRELVPERGGAFAFRHLPVDGRPWRLMAWQDVDEDSIFDPAVDFSDSLADSLLVLDSVQPRRLDLKLDVIDPNEPGEMKGRLAAEDTLAGAFLLRFFADSLRVPGDTLSPEDPRLLPDSLMAPLLARAEENFLWLKSEGEFLYDGAAPGPWWLFIHKDLVADSLWDPAREPALLEAGPRRLTPGGTLDWGRFTLPEVADTTGTEAPPDSSEAGTP